MAITKIKVDGVDHELKTTIDNVENLQVVLDEKAKSSEVIYVTNEGSVAIGDGTEVTNQISISTDDNGDVYNGVGYKNGIRWSESEKKETTSSVNGMSGYIPCTSGSILKVKNITVATDYKYIALFDSSKTCLGVQKLTNLATDENGVYSITITYDYTNIAYIRTSFCMFNPESIILVNQDFSYSCTAQVGWLKTVDDKKISPIVVSSQVITEDGENFEDYLDIKLDEINEELDGSIKSLSVSGKTITYTTNDGSTGTITTQDTDTKVTNTLSPTTKAYITGTTVSSSNTGTQIFDVDVYLDTIAGQLVAKTFKGNLDGNAKSATTSERATYASQTDADDNGDVISMTYETKNDASSKLSEAKIYTDNALVEAKSYTQTSIADLINSAPTTLDTLGEIATAMEENADVVEALDKAIGTKSDIGHTHTADNITDLQTLLDTKMDKTNPVGTGSFSMNRKSGTVVGIKSHVEGENNTASGLYTHAEGSGTDASGDAAHTEGFKTIASGRYAHAQNGGTTASGAYSHCEGNNTIASGSSQHVQGKNNINDVDEEGNALNTYAHIVGNGTSPMMRSNAHTLDWDGNAEYQGDVVANACGGENPISLVNVSAQLSEKLGVDENAVSATKLATARTINVSNGIAGVAQSFDGTKNISIPVREIYDSYTVWGGKNVVGNISAIDGATSNLHSANRFAFAEPEGIVIEYSRDAGTTWNSYTTVTDEIKTALVSGISNASTRLYIGGEESLSSATIDDQLRITFNANDMYVYTRLQKLLINISTNGAGGCYVDIEKAMNSDKTTFATIGSYQISGYSGWNSIPMGFGFGGSGTDKVGILRLTFRITYTTESYSNRLSILDIYAIGDTYWSTPSTMARIGHLYDYDAYKNVTFPANVTATSFVGNLTGKADSATKATQDASGNVIISTYETKSDATNKLNEAKTYTDTEVAKKANVDHDHSEYSLASHTHANATASTAGLIKVSSVNSSAVTVNKESTTSGRYYPVELNSDGKAIVNVPWTDTDTTYDLDSFGITATATELNYVDGVTSNIQTQLNNKAALSHNHSASDITSGTIGTDRLPTIPISKGGTGATTAAGAIVNLGAMNLTANQTVSGVKTFSNGINIGDASMTYDSTNKRLVITMS